MGPKVLEVEKPELLVGFYNSYAWKIHAHELIVKEHGWKNLPAIGSLFMKFDISGKSDKNHIDGVNNGFHLRDTMVIERIPKELFKNNQFCRFSILINLVIV